MRLISFQEFSKHKYGSYRISDNDLVELSEIDDFWAMLYERYSEHDFEDGNEDIDLLDEYYNNLIGDLNVFCLACGIYIIRLFEGVAVVDIGLVGSLREVPDSIIKLALKKIGDK